MCVLTCVMNHNHIVFIMLFLVEFKNKTKTDKLQE